MHVPLIRRAQRPRPRSTGHHGSWQCSNCSAGKGAVVGKWDPPRRTRSLMYDSATMPDQTDVAQRCGYLAVVMLLPSISMLGLQPRTLARSMCCKGLGQSDPFRARGKIQERKSHGGLVFSYIFTKARLPENKTPRRFLILRNKLSRRSSAGPIYARKRPPIRAAF